MTSRSVPRADRRWCGRSAPILGAIVALFAPAPALAQSSQPLELRWEAPAGCPSERYVRDRIRKLAGSARSTDAPVRAEATVTRSDEGQFHLELVMHSGDLVGARNIDGRSCEDLAGAAAVALALLLRSSAPLDEDALAGRDASDAAPAGSSGTKRSATAEESKNDNQRTSQPSPTQKAESAPSDRALRDERARTRRLHGLLRAPLGAFALGPLPRPSFGVAAAAGVSLDRFRVLVEGSVWRSQRVTASDDPGTGADVQRFAAGLEACWALLPGRFEVAPCLTFGLEHLRARGSGDHVAPRTGGILWPAAGVGLNARWRLLAWFGLFGGVNGQIEGSRPRLAIDGVGVLGQMLPASLTVTLGPEWIL